MIDEFLSLNCCIAFHTKKMIKNNDSQLNFVSVLRKLVPRNVNTPRLK